MVSDVFLDAAREAPVAGEDHSGDSKFVHDFAGPAVEHVDDDAVGAAFEEELSQRFEESRGVDEGTGGHVRVGYVGGEGVDGDGEAGLLVASDGVLDLESVGGCGYDG